MAERRWVRFLARAILLAAILVSSVSRGVEVENLDGHDDIFGRYAPKGDCKRQQPGAGRRLARAVQMTGTGARPA